MQLTAAVMLIVLFIKFSMVNVDVTNNDHFIPQHIAKKIASIDEILTLQNPNISTEQLIAESEITMGYIISSSFWEQQVGAALNLWTLAKWAATTGVYPVEPFVVQSKFVLPNNLSHSTSSRLLRFRDYFDLDIWNEMCLKSKLMPLVSWETFLHTKSEQLIVAMVLLKRNTECNKTLQKFVNSKFHFIREMNFIVVKKVCFVFPDQSISVHDFNARLYGDFNPKEVTVWFSLWPGVNNYRIHFKEIKFWRNTQSMDSMHPSKRIIADSLEYVRNYMESNFGQYIAVSFRSVKRAKKFHIGGISSEIQTKFFDMCINELREKLHNLGLNQKLFLSIDLGRYGDSSATNYMSNNIIDSILRHTISVVYKNRTTVEEYERSFLTATGGIDDDGYVAAVQRTIVENSNCLVMFGGNSNFQRSILNNYVKNHKSPCVIKVCYIE